MPKIEKMFAFVAEEKPGDEGVVATLINSMWLPLVGADMTRVESLRGHAQEIANRLKKEITVLEFSTRKSISKIVPQKEPHGA